MKIIQFFNYLLALLLIVQCIKAKNRDGPFGELVIINAMIIPGHGGPAYGPADIIIKNNLIDQIISYNGKTGRDKNVSYPKADKIIDATGMYVMPGLIDLHAHIRGPDLPLS